VTSSSSKDKVARLTSSDWTALFEVVLSEAFRFAWLTGPAGEILLSTDSARAIGTGRVARSDKHLPTVPTLSGPQISADLAEMVRQSVARNEPIVVGGLDLVVAGDAAQTLDVRVVPCASISAGPLALVVLVPADDQAELAIQRTHDESLQSLAALAARIAHELNNPLDGSIRYLGLAIRRLAGQGDEHDTDKVGEYLSSARAALDKIHEILSDLVRFARTGQASIEQICVNDLVDQAVKTLALRAHSLKISIVTVLADQLPAAGGARMYQVFTNLITNAIDAIRERRRHDPHCPGIVTVRSEYRDGMVAVTFEDTGVGLPDNSSQMFEPFFTTRADHGGTGLGLSIAREIVSQCSGTIRAEPGTDGGARFVVELPARIDRLETGGPPR